MNSSLNRGLHRETVLGAGSAEETIARQHGSTGVYAGIRVEVRPLARGKGTMFVWAAGANIPGRFAIAVARGVEDALSVGVLSGLDLTDVLISVEDGSYHDIDSSEAAFQDVAHKATTAAVRRANPTVLEAVSICRVTFPSAYAKAIQQMVSPQEGEYAPAESEFRNLSLTVTVPTSSVNNLLERVLVITNGQAKFSIESAGFRAKPDPPDAVNTWPSTT